MRTMLAVLLALAACKPATQPLGPAAAAGMPVKEVAVTEKGYEPSRVEVEGGRPTLLRFTRKTSDTCGEALVVEGDPTRYMLPVGKPIDVRVTPPKTGSIRFACGMDMMRGTIVAVASR